MKPTYVQRAKLLEAVAYEAARAFNFDLKRVYFNELIILDGVYGRCWYKDGVIEMRLFNHEGKEYLSRNSVLETLAHELAHLEITNHGPKHRRLTSGIFEYLKRQFKKSEDFK